MNKLILAAVVIVLSGCNAAQVAPAVTAGQLYCAKATSTGPLVVALATASGGPVSVIDKTAAYVAAACAVAGAVAVSPPANAAAAPTLTIPAVTIPLK